MPKLFCDACPKQIESEADFFSHFDTGMCVECANSYRQLQEECAEADRQTIEEAVRELSFA